ncbi:hypothetical protein INQ51_16620 [Maribellus sp. CM-23]|uniref:hypothetical protein n=1 Tax=Maribellus sp. CM-23 TaxID=2781026 RepID=UPI001F3508E2|nr:hypothetical protein [Maribellus sp. CM-23]MCE4565945.1 hypothetical protein [Maribellus sp. CM-23]
MLKRKIILLTACSLLLMDGFAQAKETAENDKTAWELARKAEGVSLYYRWLSTDSMKIREMRAQFQINAGVSKILPLFSCAENYGAWAVGVKECKIETFSDSNWVTYSRMNYPWPFKQQDLVARHLVSRLDSEIVISISAEPAFLARKEGIERMENYWGEWTFSSLNDEATSVDYRMISYTKPLFPRFMQDPVIQKLFIESCTELKQLAEKK